MAGGYVLAAYNDIKKNFPEFNVVLENLHGALIAQATREWGMPFSGDAMTAASPTNTGPMAPDGGQFAESPIMPELFLGQQTALGTLTTWNQWFNATGHQTILTGALAGGRIYEDYKIGLAGLVLLDKAIRISEIRMQIGDHKLPRINIEEAFAYEQPTIVFNEGYILDEETGFDLYAYVLSQGPQRIKLLGFQVNRVYDKLLGTVGSALT